MFRYWRIKSQGLAHTVLFFQEGNFFHLKDRDADIGMRVGLQAMGGTRGSAANMWCVGCNVSAFNEWAAKVLSLGYTVARVDEDKPGQREPGSTLVKRTLRCVYSPGTLLEGVMLDACGAQPLVTLFEGRSLRYGAAIVDVQTAIVTFASWQEADTQRSMLRALLLTADPAEVGFARGQLSPDTKRLLRQLDPVGGGGGRAVALTHIPHLRPADPDSEDPAAADILLEHTADMFLAQRGKPAAFAAARQHLTPHAAAALQLAIQHLLLTQTAQAVLPAVTLRPLDGPVGGARTSGHMLLDACALRSLELLSNSEGRVEGSLLHFLDRAATPAGRRKVRQFIANPLFRVGDIEERLATTELFMAQPQAAHSFQAGLHRAPDCERLLAKAATVLAGVVEKVAAAEEAEEEAAQAPPLPPQQQQSWGAGSRWAAPASQAVRWGAPARQQTAPAEQPQGAVDQVAHLASVLDLSQALHDLRCALLSQLGGGSSEAVLPPPLQRAVLRGEAVAGALRLLLQVFDVERFDDGCADIALESGLFGEYDAARASLEQLQASAEAGAELSSGAAAQTLDSIRQQLAAAGHGAAVLRRVKLTEYRGEQLLEVPAAVRRDLEALTAAAGGAAVLVKEAATIAKYRLPGLAATLEEIEEARDAAKLCVLRFLAESAQLFLDTYDSFRELCNALSTLDVLAGFAAATCPEAAPPGCTFCRPNFAAGVAGPSSGVGSSGASASAAPPLRLQGLWHPALLASRAVDGSSGGIQIGCYVPAAHAELAPVDRIFTRIGAQDRICRGESTFAVEMLETSSLLHHSTPASLVVLDELGRGTATHDGHAIAYGVALHLAQTKRCRSLFATHYHSLTQEPALAALVQLGHMEAAVDPRRGLLPSYRLARGPAPLGSCGVAVAAACQLPQSVVARAAEVAERAERAGRPEEQPAGGAAAAGSPGRQPLAALNTGLQQGVPPPAKRQRLDPAAAEGSALAAEQREALEAVRAATLAALAGAPGAAAQLGNLQAAVQAALAAGQL
ncbi:DNA mismatch repair Msh6 isoform X2 [Chlorella sorokiniana]|uniref:DNA mismatch repair Msh6 isoform X2 n=1 Tax=Chlorella sorokiniana TaxID=3076 RepID=A0A2P6TV08_CHLSO|nr:DNA mismatch repair Msh6 isoform X2 [Chlorella sorokiniana]|eukprot:PRW57902.1 DNA mismatch repair Msh6 isoform X2 [Chlorella sorokiniana]